MIKKVVVGLGLVGMVLFSGCSDSKEDIVENYCEALIDGDLDGMLEYESIKHQEKFAAYSDEKKEKKRDRVKAEIATLNTNGIDCSDFIVKKDEELKFYVQVKGFPGKFRLRRKTKDDKWVADL